MSLKQSWVLLLLVAVGIPVATAQIGATGYRGSTGPYGQQGVPGLRGSPGRTGAQGMTGFPGPNGPSGPVGPMGQVQYINGQLHAPAGPPGPPGPMGPAGPVGARGGPGEPGPPGMPGGPGLTGGTGMPGAQGSMEGPWTQPGGEWGGSPDQSEMYNKQEMYNKREMADEVKGKDGKDDISNKWLIMSLCGLIGASVALAIAIFTCIAQQKLIKGLKAEARMPVVARTSEAEDNKKNLAEQTENVYSLPAEVEKDHEDYILVD